MGSEKLYRCICKRGLEEFSSNITPVSIFLDNSPDGCSVDYAGERSEKEIADDFKRRFAKLDRYFGIAKLEEKDVLKLNSLGVKSSPSKNNKNHALIYDLKNMQINVMEATYLASICKISYTDL